MMKQLSILAAALAMVGLATQTADAGHRKKAKHYHKAGHHHYMGYHHGTDPRIVTTGLFTSAAATAAYFAINDWHWKWNNNSTSGAWVGAGGAYALTAVGCMAASPMVATAVVGRPLKAREAAVLMGGCALPIVGAWLVDAMWEANPQWEAFYR
jgi:hypothetical protein